MIDKPGAYALLERRGVQYEKFEHVPVYTIEDMYALDMPHKDQIVKNLFLRDDKGARYYLVTLPGDKKADLKALSEIIPSRKLSFANERRLAELLGLEPGSVTPLGLLNNEAKNVTMVFDRALEGRTVGVHPMENTATVFLSFDSLKELLDGCGNGMVICDIP